MTSEDTGAYGLDIGTNIGELLSVIPPLLPSGVMMRLGMTNPPYVLAHLEALAAFLSHPNVYSFLHVPVQSGSDSVLTAMKREYLIHEWETVVDYLLKHVPDVTVATDLIVGFPGESREDFEATLRLVRKYRLSIVNISQFYARPGTPAAKMPQLPARVKKARSKELSELVRSEKPYAALLGNTRVWVCVGAEVSKDGQYSVGHSKAYVKVLLPRDDTLQGRCALVEITSAARWHVVGRVEEVLHTEEGPRVPLLRIASRVPRTEEGAAAGRSSSGSAGGGRREGASGGSGKGGVVPGRGVLSGSRVPAVLPLASGVSESKPSAGTLPQSIGWARGDGEAKAGAEKEEGDEEAALPSERLSEAVWVMSGVLIAMLLVMARMLYNLPLNT
jgi:hypothetical protein